MFSNFAELIPFFLRRLPDMLEFVLDHLVKIKDGAMERLIDELVAGLTIMDLNLHVAFQPWYQFPRLGLEVILITPTSRMDDHTFSSLHQALFVDMAENDNFILGLLLLRDGGNIVDIPMHGQEAAIEFAEQARGKGIGGIGIKTKRIIDQGLEEIFKGATIHGTGNNAMMGEEFRPGKDALKERMLLFHVHENTDHAKRNKRQVKHLLAFVMEEQLLKVDGEEKVVLMAVLYMNAMLPVLNAGEPNSFRIVQQALDLSLDLWIENVMVMVAEDEIDRFIAVRDKLFHRLKDRSVGGVNKL